MHRRIRGRRPTTPVAALGLLLAVAARDARPAVPEAGQVARFERLTQDDGLTQGFVTAIAQDSYGFIWIGTQDGLNRYDGYEVRAFRPDGTTAAPPDGYVRCLRAGADGTMWVGTREGGLSLWDPRTETFRSWRPDPKDPDSLVFEYVNGVVVNDDGTLWVGTLEGLDLFDPRTGHARRHFRPDPKDPGSPAGKEVAFLFRDGRRLFVGYKGGALDTVDTAGGAGGAVPFRHHKDELTALGAGAVTSLARLGERLYLGTASGQLLTWNDTDGKPEAVPGFSADKPINALISVGAPPPAPPGARVAPPRVAAMSASGPGLFVGTRGGGLVYWSPTSPPNQRPAIFRNDAADTHSLPADAVQSLFVDRTGVLWAGTAVGLARLDPMSVAFRVYRRSTGVDGPPSAYVWSLAGDAQGQLWVGTDGGLSRLDRASGVWKSWTPKADDPTALASDSVTSVLVDHTGTLWAGGNHGVHRYDPATDRFESFRKGSGDPPLRNERVFTLLETRDGSLLIGTANGAMRWDPERKGFFVLGGPDLVPTVFTMAEDRDGAIWLGTFHNGLYRVDAATGAVSRLRDAAGKDLVEPQQITSLLVDRKGRLWIGTAKGAYRRDPGAASVQVHRVRDGLTNDTVMGFVEDARGMIWIATNGGIARHDPEKGTFRNYTVRDGLPTNEMNQMATGRLPGGELLFGTPAGAVLFRPEDLAPDPFPPQVALTGLEVRGVPVPIRETRRSGQPFSIARSVTAAGSLVLSHRENVFTLTFAGLHFGLPSAIRYSTRLEGWDDQWHETSAQRRAATFTNLPAGRYTFHVRAANRDGLWSESEASIALTVLPPPWKTWWAYALYGLAAIGAVAGFVSLRTGALRRRERQLEALVDERTRELLESERRATEANQAKSVFLANMSHELRTPLNAVLGFARLLDRNPSLGRDDRSGLEIIQKAGEHLLGLINDVLSLSKIEAGRLTLEPRPFGFRSLLRSVDSIIRVRADQAGLRLELVVDGELPEAVEGDEGKLRQVLVNLLSNAVKFTPPAGAGHEGRVTLRVSWRQGRAFFEVRDTGQGIAPDELGSLFQPFVQTESGRKSREGTGLGLVITRDIVRLMSGDIAVTSRVGEGTVFSFDVALPEADAALEREEEARVVGLAPGERTRRILVVDDTPENRLLLRRLLADAGLDVLEASDGREGVELWERERPDLVLMDLRMPVLDGQEAVRLIREREARRNDGKRTPIVAVTASVFEHEREAVLACGADDFLMKPFREPQLFRIVEERTGVKLRREGRRPAESAAARLTAGQLAGLTEGERARLRETLERGDFDGAAAVAEEIAGRDEPLGQLLLSEIREFRLDEILALLGKKT